MQQRGAHGAHCAERLRASTGVHRHSASRASKSGAVLSSRTDRARVATVGCGCEVRPGERERAVLDQDGAERLPGDWLEAPSLPSFLGPFHYLLFLVFYIQKP